MRRAMSGPLLALPVSVSEEGAPGKDAPGEAASENEDDDIDGHDPGDDPEVRARPLERFACRGSV